MIDYTVPLEQLPDPLPIEPLTKPFDVTITPPGSKSITNRAYVLAALAKGESRIIRPLRADDTDLLLKALCTLGAQARWIPGESGDGSEDVLITGVAGRFPRGGTVNLGDGGTPTRFMIACACLAAEPVVVDGSKRMRERPIAEGVDMLRQLGATIEYVEQEGRLPVRVTPSAEFKGGELTVGKTASSQFISAVMLIGSWLGRAVHLALPRNPTSAAYLDLTLDVLFDWGVILTDQRVDCIDQHGCRSLHNPDQIVITPQEILGRDFQIEPDASSAVYWYMAAGFFRTSTLRVPGLTAATKQPDARACALFSCDATWIDATNAPDGAIAIAAWASVLPSSVKITGLHTLRVKETDRIAALANELRKVGCVVETTEDSITVHPIKEMKTSQAAPNPRAEPGAKPIIIETYNDHRMAMAFAVLGLRVPGIQIRNPACVKKSCPGFWKDFAKLYA